MDRATPHAMFPPVVRAVFLVTVLCLLLPWHPATAADDAAVNQVPYISTYYVTPTVNIGEACRIDYYVTDFTQKEYLGDDHSETFTVDYWVNGVQSTLIDIPAGDQHIVLPPLPKGKVLFAFQATDRLGRKSHRLFQEFRVIDPGEEAIKPGQILKPDLAQFGIHADDTHPVETTAGLTAMLKWAAENGYRKVVLPAGAVFRIDENATVQMASGVTLDMNGSTFKLNPSAVNKSLMLEFINCTDSHVINGVFEGDLKSRDFTDPKNHAEWVNCMSISEGSEYCTVQDVTIRDITGYGTCTNHRHTYDRAQTVQGFELGDLDAHGQPIPSTVRTTSAGFVDISAFVKTHGFFQMGVYLGYQGNPAGHWIYRAHLYDADKKYLETVEGYLYRRLYPRKDARFARFTLLSTAQPTTLRVFNFRAPYNCAYLNVRHENIRCVGMALAGFVNMLVDGCRFENCGWKLARCAFDAEDGWDLMNDLTFRNNVFGTNPVNEFVTCGGHNFVMEKNTMKAYIWDRTNGYVFRDNDLKSATFKFATGTRTGYPRIYKNRIPGSVSLERERPDPARPYAIRDNVCGGGVNTRGPAPWNTYFYKCTIQGGAATAQLRDCDVNAVTNIGGLFIFEDSRVRDCSLKTTGAGVVSRISGSTITKSTFVVQGAALEALNNQMADTLFSTTQDWSPLHTLRIVGNRIETTLTELVSVGNTYKLIELRDNVIRATQPGFAAVRLRNPLKGEAPDVTVSGNRFEAPGGWVIRADRAPDKDTKRTFTFGDNDYGRLEKVTDNLRNQPSVVLQDTDKK